jgi:hypothetical protein
MMPIRLQEQNEYEKRSEERHVLRSAMTHGVFRLAVHETVDELESVLQLSGPVHREPRAQEGEQQDDDEHHHEAPLTMKLSHGRASVRRPQQLQDGVAQSKAGDR